MSEQEKKDAQEPETPITDEVVAHAEEEGEDTPWCGVCKVAT